MSQYCSSGRIIVHQSMDLSLLNIPLDAITEVCVQLRLPEASRISTNSLFASLQKLPQRDLEEPWCSIILEIIKRFPAIDENQKFMLLNSLRSSFKVFRNLDFPSGFNNGLLYSLV